MVLNSSSTEPSSEPVTNDDVFGISRITSDRIRIYSDQDAEKGYQAIRSLSDSLLKYRFQQYPLKFQRELAIRMLSDGVKTRIPEETLRKIADTNGLESSDAS